MGAARETLIAITLPETLKDPVDSLAVLELDRPAGELKVGAPAR